MRGPGSEGCQLVNRIAPCGCRVTALVQGGYRQEWSGLKMFQACQAGAMAVRTYSLHFLGAGREGRRLAGGKLWVVSKRGAYESRL